jgi:hypothetical protein
MEDAARYFEEIVEPTIAEYERYPTSRRLGFLACIAIFHTVDYLTYPADPGNRLKQFRAESPAFLEIDRIANAAKHFKSGHPKSSTKPLLQSAVIERPSGIWDEADWDISRWDDPVGGVTLQDNLQFDLLTTLKSAAEFLRTKLVTMS